MGDQLYAECQKSHPHNGGKTDGCQEFSGGSLSLPECMVCGCHRNYHRKLVYTKCNKVRDFKIPNSVDGCQLFIPDSAPWLFCAACGCHRNFHRIEVTKEEVVSTAFGTAAAAAVPFELKKEPLS
ncbi:hypothetical protein ABFX02_10G120200 [Erythranthe guttata]